MNKRCIRLSNSNTEISISFSWHNYFSRAVLVFFFLFIFTSIAIPASGSENLIINPSGNADLDGWTATSGMELEYVDEDGVYVFGTQEGRHNYARIDLSDKNLKPGQKYRLEAEIKIEYISDSTNTPLLKAEARDDQGTWLTNYNTSKTNSLFEVWQKVETEFNFHSDGDYARVFVEKGTTGNINAALYVRNVKLFKISEKSDIHRLSLSTKQLSQLEDIKDIHPKIMLNTEKISFLQNQLDTDPYEQFWASVKQSANVDQSLPQSASRGLGEKLANMALAYLMTSDSAYLDSVKNWMNAIIELDFDDKDLITAHTLFGMSLAYDWLYDDLTQEERTKYKNFISELAEQMYEVYITKSLFWADAYLQNHNYTNMMALSVAGLSLYGKSEYAESWIAAAQENFEKVLLLLSDDGSTHEGVGYWGYLMQSLLDYYFSFNSHFEMDHFIDHKFFKQATTFRLQASMPDFIEVVDYADSPRHDWHGPGYILRGLANLYKDPTAQWLAEKLDSLTPYTGGANLTWRNMIWYDPDVEQVEPADIEKKYFFENLGLVFNRSAWSENAVWSFFKAGAPQGKIAYDRGFYAGSHIHPDQGHYSLWAHGNWIIIDDGYVRNKQTQNHNVLLFNGHGQLGEGKTWFDKDAVAAKQAKAEITHASSESFYQFHEAEIHEMYPSAANLEYWKRTFIHISDNVLVIRDDYELNDNGSVESNVHFNNDCIIEKNTDHIDIEIEDTYSRMLFYTENNYSYSVSDFVIPEEYRHTHGTDYNRKRLSIEQENSKTSTFIKTIYISKDKESLVDLELEKSEDDTYQVKVSDNIYKIDFDNKTVHKSEADLRAPRNIEAK